jgi:hypothetical protein
MPFMKSMFLAYNYTADKASGANNDSEADYTTRRLVVGNENADNGQRQQPNLRSKDWKTVLWSSILC